MKNKIEFDVILEINETETRKQFNKEIEELTKSIEEYKPIINEIKDFKEFIISGYTNWLTSRPLDAKKLINQEYDIIIDHLNRINRR